MQTILTLFGAIISYAVYEYVSGLWKNIKAAKRSGLPYIIARMDPYLDGIVQRLQET